MDKTKEIKSTAENIILIALKNIEGAMQGDARDIKRKPLDFMANFDEILTTFAIISNAAKLTDFADDASEFWFPAVETE